MNDSKTNENKTGKNCLCKKRYFLLFLVIVVVVIFLLAKFSSSPKRIFWSEGIAIASEIARELKGYASDTRENGHYPPTWEDLENLLAAEYPNGKRDALVSEKEGNFRKEHFNWEAKYEPNLDPPIEFKIIITRPKGCEKPDAQMLNNKGELFFLDDDGKWVHW